MPTVRRLIAGFLARSSLGAVVLIVVAMALLHLWLPFGISAYSPYIGMNLLEKIQTRALVGTLLQALSAHPATQARLLAAVNMLALFVWLMCVLKIIEQGCGLDGAATKSAMIRVFWVLLFTFSVNPYNAVIGLFVDMPAAALVAATAWLCLRPEPRTPWWRIGLVTTLALAAMLVHEKSIFDFLILFLWLSWRHGPGMAASLLAPALSLSAIFLLLASGQAGWGLPARDYAAFALSLRNPVIAESFNVWGIVLGGGAFWLVYPILGRSWRRAASAQRERSRRTALLSGMALLCFAPLLIAHDTNRLTALIWLPVALLAGNVPVERALSSARLAWAGIGLLVFQLAMPPSLVFQNGMVPYNCYASAIAGRLPKESQAGQAGNFSLMSYDRNGLTVGMAQACR